VQLELESCVQFCGFVTNIAERIAALDLVVHASTISEPFGQVIIEGMAAGKAVIATRGGGVSEIVEDGVSGLLVPMKDPTALAQAMLLLLRDPVRRAQLGAAARQRVGDKFRIEYTAEKVLRLYQELALS
jgi:glycosyltransferase involved in cell wall biosynthesis